MPFVAAPNAGLVEPEGTSAGFTPELIAGAPGVIVGVPGVIAVPAPCAGMAVVVLPGVMAVRGLAGAAVDGAEPACAKVRVELVAAKSVPL